MSPLIGSIAVAFGLVGLVAGLLQRVWGERDGRVRRTFWIGLPSFEGGPVSFHDRFGAMIAGTIPWVLTYNGMKLTGAYANPIETRMPWEWHIPIQGWTAPLYASPFLLVPLAFLVVSEREALRQFLLRTWLCTGIATLIYMAFPLTAAFRPPEPGILHDWVVSLQAASWPAVASWPSFHVLWAFLIAHGLSGKLPAWLRYGWAIGVALTCLTTGMHSVADVAAGLGLWALCRNPALLLRR